jgi:sec-independent protein translocase protein TatC
MPDDHTHDTAPLRAAEGVMSLGQHLEELRVRVIYCILAVVGAAIVTWAVRWQIMAIIVRPHVLAMSAFNHNVELHYLSYLEPLMAQVKACTIAALIVTAPFLLYQAWAFVAPGLFPNERRWVLKLVVPSLLCFVAGATFGYFVFMPTVFHYLLVLAGPSTQPDLMIGSYLSLFFALTFAMGIAFQTPIVVACLIRWKIVRVETLQRQRKVMILVAFIVAAVITPPDPVSQILMALPLIVLFDLGMLAAAPSRATLKSFSQFTGIVIALGLGLMVYVNYWPVAHATALRGGATLAGKGMSVGLPQSVRRGERCVAGPKGLVKISFGSATLYLAGPGTLLVHGPGKVTLQRGDVMAESPSKKARITLYAGPAVVDVSAAQAEVEAPDAGSARVAVFSGRVKVESGGAQQQIEAGREQTFYSGGRPADLSSAEKHWQDLLGPPAASP